MPDAGFWMLDLDLTGQRPPEAVEPESLGAKLRELLDAVAPSEVAAEEAELVGAAHGAPRAEELDHRAIEAGQVHHVQPPVALRQEGRLVEVDDVDRIAAHQDVLH